MRRIIGVILIAISAASFGTLAIFGRFAYAAGIDVFTLLFLRFGSAAIFMVLILMARRESLPRGKTLLQLIGMGALGYVGQSYSYLTAVKYASAGLVALLLYLYPIFVALLSAIFLKERFNRWKIISIGLAFLGAALTARPEGGQWQGIFFALSAAAIYSIYIIVGTGVMKQVSAIQSSTVIFASAGAIYLMLTALNGAHFPTTITGWGIVAGIVVIATIIPVVAFLTGLQRIGPTNASLLSTLEPVVTVALAAVIFHEALGPLTLIGGALILISVIILTRSEFRQN